MKISEHITNTIESWSVKWKDRLKGWMASWVAFGIEVFFDVLGKSAAPKLKPIIDTLEATGKVPPELQKLIDELKEPTGQAGAMFANSAGSALIGGALGKIIDALFLPLAYAINSATQNVILAPPQLLSLWHRGEMTEAQVDEYLSWLGYDDTDIGHWKLMSWFLPGPMDLVRWYAREVFEPDMIERYGLESEFPTEGLPDFAKVGVTPTQAKNYWMAHWEHASYMQIREMLHRGVLSLDKEMPSPPTTKAGWADRDAEGIKAAYDWYRLVEIPPFWRARLTEMMFEVPTRVDVRRWWDMRTIDEAELYNIYHRQGYHGKDLDNYVLWTKVYVAFPDLMARWTKGWITLDDVRSELTGLGMPAARVEEMIQTKVKPGTAERTASEKDITKSEIVKGVKKGVISRGEGAELLIDLGYDEDEATYILDINIPIDEEDEVVNERQLTKADILKGLKTEIITREEARDKLLGLRYSATDAEFLLKVFDAQVKPPEEPREREASKADIVLGVKKGLITQEEGYGMLLDLGFTAEAAQFILMVKTEESPFSPINYAEFKDLTQEWRKVVGMEAKPMTEELKKTAQQLIRLRKEVDALSAAIKEEERTLIDGEILPEAATAKRDELRVALHRAEAALHAAQTNYDSLLAQWRHGP